MYDYHSIFVTHHLYYIPQFLPIAKELTGRGKNILFLLLALDAPEQNKIAVDFLKSNGLNYKLYNKNDSPLSCLFMINGANSFPTINISYKYSALVLHGIGTKAGYYIEEQNRYYIRFVEGGFRVDKIKELYPDIKTKLFNVGFAKLDEAFAISPEDKKRLIEKYGLETSKKTILYAPTFYPSSIDNMPEVFPESFTDYNIIIKPHFFSFSKKKYRKHVRKFNIWNEYDNVHVAGVEEFNLVPFMSISDIMISDESSAIFEFAALNKPVIVNRDVRYRLTYRIFKSKIRKRMDKNMSIFKNVGVQTHSFDELCSMVENELKHPQHMEEQRKKICDQIVGPVDGTVSVRIADIMETFEK